MMSASRGTARWVAGLTLLAACAGPATRAQPVRAVSADIPRQVSVHQPRPPVRLSPAAVFAQSVRGSSVLATATRTAPAGAGQGPVTVVVFDPAGTRLVLHAGSAEPVGQGRWARGPAASGSGRGRVVAVFNSGFKTKDAHGGWMSQGRVAVPLVRGAASVVMYADSSTDIGSWGTEVPAPGRRVVAVRQNLQLLVDGGRPQRTRPRTQAQLNAWWGHAFRDAPLVSRSALGITADGSLVYAGGTRVTVAALAAALLSHGVVRALELDINAPLVRGFLLAGDAAVRTAGGSHPAALPLVVGQTQGAGYPTSSLRAPHCTYVTSCPRDFFTVELR